MPVHDWSQVEAGVYHDFHNAWIIMLRNALNGGLLPAEYYALVEQHAGQYVPDILTLHASSAQPPPAKRARPVSTAATC
jgi:sulfite reductase beta subunit-like hemoprotein